MRISRPLILLYCLRIRRFRLQVTLVVHSSVFIPFREDICLLCPDSCAMWVSPRSPGRRSPFLGAVAGVYCALAAAVRHAQDQCTPSHTQVKIAITAPSLLGVTANYARSSPLVRTLCQVTVSYTPPLGGPARLGVPPSQSRMPHRKGGGDHAGARRWCEGGAKADHLPLSSSSSSSHACVYRSALAGRRSTREGRS